MAHASWIRSASLGGEGEKTAGVFCQTKWLGCVSLVSVFTRGCEAVSLWLIYHCLSNYHPMALRVPQLCHRLADPHRKLTAPSTNESPCKYLLLTLADTLFPILRSGGPQPQHPPPSARERASQSCGCCPPPMSVCAHLRVVNKFTDSPLHSPPPPSSPPSVAASSHRVCIVAGSLSAHSSPLSAPV